MPAKNTNLKSLIRDVPDFPKKGIVFKDITPLLADSQSFHQAVTQLIEPFRGRSINKVVAIESRGFIFGGAIATALGAGFIPVRKKGKLPYRTRAATYQLEYGADILEMHVDALGAGDKVLIVDDVLATGGTAQAAAELVEGCGADVTAMAFLIELLFLGGRKKVSKWEIHSLIQY